MRTMLRIVTAGAFALCTFAGFTAAKADVIRVAMVVADSQADYDNNAALLDTFSALLKKGNAKAVYVGSDPENDHNDDFGVGERRRCQRIDGQRRLESRGWKAEGQDL